MNVVHFQKIFRRVAPVVKDPKNERIRLASRSFLKRPIEKIRLQKKLEPIEGRYLASIWKCFNQICIGKSMEMFNLVLQFLLIPQWNAEQDASRSMPGSDLQLVPTFF